MSPSAYADTRQTHAMGRAVATVHQSSPNGIIRRPMSWGGTPTKKQIIAAEGVSKIKPCALHARTQIKCAPEIQLGPATLTDPESSGEAPITRP